MAVRTTEDSIVFACYAKACAPPPVGRGGSVKGGRKGGKVIRPSGGGDGRHVAKVGSKAIAKATTARYGTRGGEKIGGSNVRTGSKPKTSDTQTRVDRASGSTTRKTSRNRLEHLTHGLEKSVAAKKAADKNKPGGIGGGSIGKSVAKVAAKVKPVAQQSNSVNKRLPKEGTVGDKALRAKIISQADKGTVATKGVKLNPAEKAAAQRLLAEHNRVQTALSKAKPRSKREAELDDEAFKLWDRAGFTRGGPMNLADALKKSIDIS